MSEIDDLNAALKSEVRHELRADYKTFPLSNGRNTHYAIRRQRLFGLAGGYQCPRIPGILAPDEGAASRRSDEPCRIPASPTA